MAAGRGDLRFVVFVTVHLQIQALHRLFAGRGWEGGTYPVRYRLELHCGGWGNGRRFGRVKGS
ncbi:hypothetical protein B0H10DRAFT_2071719 [Mycena sp. CBHHK59/15]|nr:hypothetical protein B0H10DRAFT_2071719 [Mycena sp. CBHHK59/15]